MSTRRQRSRKNQPPEPLPVVESDLSVFAGRVAAEKARRRDEKRTQREARRHAEDLTRLVAVKDDAAGAVKRLRGREGVTAAQRGEADAAYRHALAALVLAETGEAPSWATSTVAIEADPEDPGAAGEGEGPADASVLPEAEAGTGA